MYCLCYVNYEMFDGFETTKHVNQRVTHHTETSTIRQNTTISDKHSHPKLGKTKKKKQLNETHTITSHAVQNETKIKKAKLEKFKTTCPETELPINIGTYEIPTQRDLVLFTKRTLLKMFNSYHKKTLHLLKDIKEATRASTDYEKNCIGQSKLKYKNCVNRISKKCVVITKNLVSVLENQRLSVDNVLKDKTCVLKNMKTDPIELVKTLAVDEASLEFALPAFLRLIGGCSAYCSKILDSKLKRPRRQPLRHMTDQDLVVKHFLTNKNYIQLIKESDVNM